MIEDTEITVLPEDGIISMKDLAKMLDIGIDTLINGLSKQNIPYIKLTRFHRHWMIRLQDLKPHIDTPPMLTASHQIDRED